MELLEGGAMSSDERAYQLEVRKYKALRRNTYITALVALAAVAASAFAIYANNEWQSGLFKIQLAEDPQQFYCSDSVKLILQDELLSETSLTSGKLDAVCKQLQTLAPPLAVRQAYVELLINHPGEADQIRAAYHKLYGDSATWVDVIADAAAPAQ
jgi:hypothetical protein